MVATPSTMVPLGIPAPAFELAEPDGTVWTLDRVAGPRGTLVAFVCNHCPYVGHVAGGFGAAAARWRRQGLGVIGINSNDGHPGETPTEMTEQAAAWRWTFPYVSDPTQTVARAYGAVCTPDFFLYDARRALVYRGRFDAARPGNGVPVTGDELGAAVDAVFTGEEIVEIGQLPSIGCGIKWRE